MAGFEFITEEMLEQFFGFFEAVYEVEFTDRQCDQIYRVLRSLWKDPDDSAVPLLAAVFSAAQKLRAASGHERRELKRSAHERLTELFEKRAVNARGRLLDQLYDAIEQRRPGVTGIKKVRRVGRPDPDQPISPELKAKLKPKAKPRPKVKPKPEPKPEPSLKHTPMAYPQPGATPARRSTRSAGVLERAIAAFLQPAANRVAAPAGPAVPPLPYLGHLSPGQQALEMARHFEDKVGAMTAAGDMMGARQALQSQEQWAAMGTAINRGTADLNMKIINNIR